MTSTAALVYHAGTQRGESEQFDRTGIFNGGDGVTVSATGVVSLLPLGVYRIRCLTAGTVRLYDNTAASGTLLMPDTAMLQGATIEIGEYTSIGLYATVTSGTYRIVRTPA